MAQTNEPTVFLLDDDLEVQQSLATVARSMQTQFEIIKSAHDFFTLLNPLLSGCLIVDIHSTGMSGLKLLENLQHDGVFFASIAISAPTNVATAVRAMRAGAITVLEKPLGPEPLESALREALQLDAEFRQRQSRMDRIRRRMKKLNDGECDVLKLLLAGKLNREIAESLEVSVRTVEVRRAKVMEKMKAESLAELIRDNVLLEIYAEQKFM